MRNYVKRRAKQGPPADQVMLPTYPLSAYTAAASMSASYLRLLDEPPLGYAAWTRRRPSDRASHEETAFFARQLEGGVFYGPVMDWLMGFAGRDLAACRAATIEARWFDGQSPMSFGQVHEESNRRIRDNFAGYHGVDGQRNYLVVFEAHTGIGARPSFVI